MDVIEGIRTLLKYYDEEFSLKRIVERGYNIYDTYSITVDAVSPLALPLSINQ